MAFFKKNPPEEELMRGGGDSSMFGITLQQLNEIGELQGKALIEKLNSPTYNGVNGILNKLKVDANKGLDSNNKENLEHRQTAYGKNQYPRISEPSLLTFVVDHEDWKARRAMRKAQEENEKTDKTTVIRDNRTQEILLVEVVVGDICPLNAGYTVPADGLIIQSNGLKVDESSLTGENGLITKNEGENARLFSDTVIKEGSGRMVVTGVGLNSQTGRIITLLKSTTLPSE